VKETEAGEASVFSGCDTITTKTCQKKEEGRRNDVSHQMEKILATKNIMGMERDNRLQ
jgi:hypothetical protein